MSISAAMLKGLINSMACVSMFCGDDTNSKLTLGADPLRQHVVQGM